MCTIRTDIIKNGVNKQCVTRVWMCLVQGQNLQSDIDGTNWVGGVGEKKKEDIFMDFCINVIKPPDLSGISCVGFDQNRHLSLVIYPEIISQFT